MGRLHSFHDPKNGNEKWDRVRQLLVQFFRLFVCDKKSDRVPTMEPSLLWSQQNNADKILGSSFRGLLILVSDKKIGPRALGITCIRLYASIEIRVLNSVKIHELLALCGRVCTGRILHSIIHVQRSICESKWKIGKAIARTDRVKDIEVGSCSSHCGATI